MSDTEERRTLGSRLRDARKYLGYTQDEVAAHLGIPRPAITLIESGDRGVDALELKRLAALYQRPIGYFLATGERDLRLDDIPALRDKAAGLGKADIAELVQFADFLRGRKERKAQ